MKIIPRSSKQRFEDGQPGLYAGVPEAIYHAFDACSNSRLNHMRRSPAHCRHEILNPSTPTEAMNQGTAYHLAVLEPDRFKEEVRVLHATCDARTQKGAPCTYAPKIIDADSGLHLCGVHSKKSTPLENLTLISNETLHHVREMRAATLNHPAAKELLSKHVNEVSMLWTFGELLCKARIDSWNEQHQCIIDLKKTQDAAVDAFARSVANFGYHRQGGMYVDGARTQGLDVRHYVIIAQEYYPPYGCAVYRLTAETLEAGREDLEKSLVQYHQCQTAGQWPGYPEHSIDLDLPAWMLRKIYRD